MKYLFLSWIVLTIVLVSCIDGRPTKPLYPKYEYGYTYDVPDSLKDDVERFVTNVVTGTNKQLKTSDYEDPEDVVEEAYDAAKNLYTQRIEGLYVTYTENSMCIFKPYYLLTDNEKKIFQVILSGK